MGYQMNVPKGYEEWKRKYLEKQKKDAERRKRFEKSTEDKVSGYVR